jgi:hypothetical protein
MRHAFQSAAFVVLGVLVTSCAGRAPPTPDAGVTTTTDAGTSLPDAGTGPQLVVAPLSCEFGRVGVGVTAFCDIALQSTGDQDLQITNIRFDSSTDTTAFGSASIFSLPTFISAHSSTTVRMFARAAALQTYTGNLQISIENHTTVDVTVPLAVTGALIPTACARVKSINGVANTQASPAVQPLDDVVLTGDCSTPSRAGGTITSYHWTMDAADRPVESTVVLTDPNAVDTGFAFNPAGGSGHGVDAAGLYTVHLSVTDNDGLTSTSNAYVTLSVVPTGGIHVQLTWDTPNDEVDLHLLRNHGALCSSDDCYAANCVATSPNWGGGSHDPHSSGTDTTGFGPEDSGVLGPIDGDTYTVSVNALHLASSSNVTLKVFLFGALRFQETRTLDQTGVEWTVADVQWSNTPALVPVDTFENAPVGACLVSP